MTGKGRVLANRFEILGRVGAGGMGSVYRAVDRTNQKIVAVKELHAIGAEDKERFARECDFLAALNHPGIVRHIAHGISPEGARYLVMEWVDGPTLSQELKRRTLTLKESVEIATTIAKIVSGIHARGILHRDIKPSNIVLQDGDIGRPKLLDFGVARLEGSIGGGITATGLVVGSAGYLSPEQAMGREDIDARADVFALGCLLFKCITGRVPFRGDDPLTVLLKITLEEAPRARDFVPSLLPAVDDAIAKLLSREREHRPRDASEVAELLTHLALEDDETGRPSLVDGAITAAEHRLTSLVLAKKPRQLADTLSDVAAMQPSRENMQRALSPFGLTPEIYADGTLVVMISHATDPLPDVAKRAVRAATAVRDADPSLFIAVTTGRATDGRAVMVSDTVDRAASLLSYSMLHGSPGDVGLDDATAALVESTFEIERTREAARLVSERTDSRIRTVFGRQASCIGRDEELAAIRSVFARSLNETSAQVALVLGQAGIGKSRVCHEVVKGLHRQGVEVWVARGDPITQHSPFGMLGPVLFDLAGITRGESDEDRWDKLDQMVEQRASGPGSRRIAEFLGAICGVEIARAPSQSYLAAKRDVSLMGDQMRRALVDFVAAISRERPLAIAMEDVQWADPATISFVDAMLGKLSELPLFVLALARPEVNVSFPALFAARNLTTLHLPALAEDDAARLARELLGEHASDDTVGKVVRRASGNPFFLEELARAALSGSLGTMPDSVLAVLEARFETLPPDARRVLRAAAVFGRHFWEGGIRALLPKVDARAELMELEAADLIIKSRRSRFRGQAEYAFRHAVHVEAAYARLPDEDKKRAHRAAARWLEEAGERDPIVLAGHFERADDAESAVGLLAVAAHLALEAGDLEQSTKLAARALNGGAFGEERGRVHATAAEANLWLARTTDALMHAKEALERLAPGDSAWCTAASVAITAAGRTGDRASLAKFANAVFELGSPVEPSSERIVLLSQIAIQLVFVGDIGAADQAFSQIPQGSAQREANAAAWYFRARAWRALAAGDPGGYGMLMKRSASSFEQIGDDRNACVQRVNVAYASMCLGQLEEAVAGFDAVIAVALAMGLANVVAVARHNGGLARSWLGQREEGERDERLALEAFREQRDDRMVGACASYLARILLDRGQVEEAEAVARDGLFYARAHPPVRALLHATLGETLSEKDRRSGRPPTEETLASTREAMRLLAELGGVDEGEGYIRYVHARVTLENLGLDGARDAVLDAKHCLEMRAARLASDSAREGFLGRVPEHRATMAMARRFNAQ